jgi:hypothetical protein
MNQHSRLAVAALTLGFWIGPAWACLHFKNGFSVNQNRQSFISFHDGAYAHLIIATELSSKKMPPQLSWILPLPSRPERITTVSKKLLADLRGLIPVLNLRSVKSQILVHAPIQVDGYRIEPIEILSDGRPEQLNDYLLARSFKLMPEAAQRPYLKKGAFFLAITFEKSPKHFEMNPLHIAYKANELSIPLSFRHADRDFNVEWFVFGSKVIANNASVKSAQLELQNLSDDFIQSKAKTQIFGHSGNSNVTLTRLYSNSLKSASGDPKLGLEDVGTVPGLDLTQYDVGKNKK